MTFNNEPDARAVRFQQWSHSRIASASDWHHSPQYIASDPLPTSSRQLKTSRATAHSPGSSGRPGLMAISLSTSKAGRVCLATLNHDGTVHDRAVKHHGDAPGSLHGEIDSINSGQGLMRPVPRHTCSLPAASDVPLTDWRSRFPPAGWRDNSARPARSAARLAWPGPGGRRCFVDACGRSRGSSATVPPSRSSGSPWR